MMIGRIFRYFKRLKKWIYFKCEEEKYKHLRYLYFTKNSDSLIICFSAFPPTNARIYNYVNGFSSLLVDRLYIADTFGHKGSYYLYDYGNDYPFVEVNELINIIIERGKYKQVFTAGSSKGGSAAIIFGLQHHVKAVFSGACQYHIGSYLNNIFHKPIFEAMKGALPYSSQQFETTLNNVMPDIIKRYADTSTIVHLVYSKFDKTYDDHIVDLIEDLKKSSIPIVEKEYFFKNHDEVGHDFIQYVNDYLGIKQ